MSVADWRRDKDAVDKAEWSRTIYLRDIFINSNSRHHIKMSVPACIRTPTPSATLDVLPRICINISKTNLHIYPPSSDVVSLQFRSRHIKTNRKNTSSDKTMEN